jgi:hypothetical protein
MGGACSILGDTIDACFGQKALIKWTIGRPSCTRQNNVKMDLREMGCYEYGLHSCASGEQPVVVLTNTAINLLVP